MYRICCVLLVLILGSCRPNDPTSGNEVGPEGQNSSNQVATLPPPDANPVLGEWVSTLDKREKVVLSASQFVSYYDGVKMVDKPLTYYQRCPDNCGGPVQNVTQPCFRLEAGAQANCYAIVSVSDTLLEISMLGGRGNTLRYRRIR